MKFCMFITGIVISLLFTDIIYAQMVYKNSDMSTGTTTTFGGSQRKAQLLYKPDDFNLQIPGAIESLYFMYHTSSVSPDFTNFKIKLGTTADTNFTSTNFYNNLTEVFNESQFSIPSGTSGSWFKIPLQSVFSYDAVSTLIVEVSWEATTFSTFQTKGEQKSGRKLSSSSASSSTGVLVNPSIWDNFGLDFNSTSNMLASKILEPDGFIKNNSSSVKAIFANAGFNSMSGKYYLEILNPSNNTIYNDSLEFNNLQPGIVDTVIFPNINNLNSSGIYKVICSVNSPGDEILDDNSTQSEFYRFFHSNSLLLSYDGSTGKKTANRDSIINALHYLCEKFDVYDRSDTTVSDFSSWKTIIWCEEDSIRLNERAALKSFLDLGTASNQKSLMVLGEDVLYYHDFEGSAKRDSIFTQDYLHAVFLDDDGNGSIDRNSICGDNINKGLCDSMDVPSPDGMTIINGSREAFRFGNLHVNNDTLTGVSYDGLYFNTLMLGFQASQVYSEKALGFNRVLAGSINWILSTGDIVPVELASLSAKTENNNVILTWETASERNNKGFFIERKNTADFEEIFFVEGRGTTAEKNSYIFTDKNLKRGSYIYRLKQIDYDGSEEFSDEVSVKIDNIIAAFSLEQNYPNPFNPSTIIKYSIPEDSFVSLSLFNTLGEKVMDLVNQDMKAGSYSVEFNAYNLTDISSGIYFYKLEAEKNISVRKMMFLK